MSTSDLTISTESAEALLKSARAWTSGHFQLTSGLHSREYMQCQKVMQYPRLGMKLAAMLVARLKDEQLIPDVVVGPALGAIHWEVYVASALDQLLKPEKPVRAVFAEKQANDCGEPVFAIRRGIQLEKGDRVLVVEDVTTTGGSLKKVLQLVESLGATPIAAGAIVDRSGGSVEFSVPFIKLLSLNLETWQPAECPMCKAGQPIDKPGSSTAK